MSPSLGRSSSYALRASISSCWCEPAYENGLGMSHVVFCSFVSLSSDVRRELKIIHLGDIAKLAKVRERHIHRLLRQGTVWLRLHAYCRYFGPEKLGCPLSPVPSIHPAGGYSNIPDGKPCLRRSCLVFHVWFLGNVQSRRGRRLLRRWSRPQPARWCLSPSASVMASKVLTGAFQG